jgi:hypothetical protein
MYVAWTLLRMIRGEDSEGNGVIIRIVSKTGRRRHSPIKNNKEELIFCDW